MGAHPAAGKCYGTCSAVARGGPVLIHVVESTGSTNADLLAATAAGQGAEGDWLIARRQTAGRGRQGRHWDSPEGNFHGSTIVRLRAGDPPAASLSLVAGIALYDAMMAVATNIADMHLKWPNDLMVGAAKLGGILLERAEDVVVCGIGVNLGWAPELPDRATVSLANLGQRSAVGVFAGRLAICFDAACARWRTEPQGALHAHWLACAHPVGTALTRMDAQGNTLTGRFDGLEEDGSLRLRTPDGALLRISSGEVLRG